ncbi:MAG: hypothetical protein U9R04_06140 [Chloroflexota bacterium]|nr:hypothetical protein [Chloroflexota bacterium]
MEQCTWLLTDEEIKQITAEIPWDSSHDGRSELGMVTFMQDAKTKRKLVEWIASMGQYQEGPSSDTFSIPKPIWNALCQEVGAQRRRRHVSQEDSELPSPQVDIESSSAAE